MKRSEQGAGEAASFWLCLTTGPGGLGHLHMGYRRRGRKKGSATGVILSLIFFFVIMVFPVLMTEGHDISSKVPKEARGRRNPLAWNEEVLGKGQSVYEQLCLSCHGPSGKGDGPGAHGSPHPPPDFAGLLDAQTDGDLFWKISRGGGAMPSFQGTLSEEARWQVIRYLRALGGGKEKER